jgi:hypothetical protein
MCELVGWAAVFCCRGWGHARALSWWAEQLWLAKEGVAWAGGLGSCVLLQGMGPYQCFGLVC